MSQPESDSAIPTATTDKDLRQCIRGAGDAKLFAEYATTWCPGCKAIYPHFKALAKQNKQHRYVLTHCEYLDKEARGIRHTPTFKVFHHGRVVDRFIAVEHRELADHIWLHSED